MCTDTGSSSSHPSSPPPRPAAHHENIDAVERGGGQDGVMGARMCTRVCAAAWMERKPVVRAHRPKRTRPTGLWRKRDL